MKHWYVYKLTFSDGTFYYGYRGSICAPDKDLLVKYFSSSKTVKLKINNRIQVSKEILLETLVKEDAFIFEQQLIEIYLNSPLCINKVCYYKRKGFGLLDNTTRKILSNKTKARWQNIEFKEKISKKQKLSWTDERKQKHSKTMAKQYTEGKQPQLVKGRYCKGGKNNAGKKQTLEHIQNRTSKRIGSTHSIESKQKISLALSRTSTCIYCGKTMSISTCTRYHNNNCRTIINGSFCLLP
jgi:hypothetical protein